jgi:hypothetical protein
MPARNPEAVRQRAMTAHQRTGQPVTQPLTRCSWPSTRVSSRPENGRQLSCTSGSTRDEQYATLGANVAVELFSESHARKPTTRAWATSRRADRSQRLAQQSRSGRWQPMLADPPLSDACMGKR